MAEQIGTVSHYYGNAGAAVVQLTAPLKVGETVTIKRGDTEFTQVVDSLQVERAPVESAKAGTSVGLKVREPVKPGAAVFRGETT